MGDDEELTSTIEEQLADEALTGNDGREDPQTQPLSEEELREENAETSLDQPSDSSS